MPGKYPYEQNQQNISQCDMGSRKYLNTWGGEQSSPYIKVLKMLETWLHGMSDTSNESLEHV